jgi:hypothetical protein
LGLVSLAAGTAGWKAAPAAGAPGAAAPTSDVSRLSPEAARMYAAVRNPRPGELGWQQIPWGVDLQQGIQRAREEGRPLLLFVSGDDPLEKC